MRFFIQTAITLAAFTVSAQAQTWTDCNPMNRTDCAPNTALGISNYSINLDKSVMTDTVWNTTAGKVTYNTDGAAFIVNQKGDSPTVKTNFYIFFGQVEVIMRAATGQGIVSSIVLQSDDLDEVDWEWIGGNNSYVQTNYFGKANPNYLNSIWHPVNDVQGVFHNYTTDWSKEKIDWYIDGQLIRTLKYEDADGGKHFPQTPCDVRLGIWAGGDKANPNGTIAWSGGLVDYNKGPYTMTVKSVRVSDASSGTQYQWGDQTGSYDSIKILNTTAAMKLDGNNGGSVSGNAQQRWNGLSHTQKIIVAAVVLGVVVLCAAVFAFCCIRQRRIGKHEKLLEDAKFEKDRAELMAYRAEMGRMRSEKLAMMQQQRFAQPSMGNAGATVMQSSASMRSANYAPSMNSYNSGRGYQRY